MAATPATTMTIEELAALPDDGYRHELMRGELVTMPPAGFDHSRIGAGIVADLVQFVRQHRLGHVTQSDGGYVLQKKPPTLLAPDAAFVRADRLPANELHPGFLELPPDLVVEVVSPSDSTSYVNDKVLTYLELGVRLVWVVDPRRRIVQVFTPDYRSVVLREGDTLTGADVLPGFILPIERIFDS
jgi:Uma2 family endonuclease